MTCNNCGAEIEKESYICPRCGMLTVDLFSEDFDLNGYDESIEIDTPDIFKQLESLDFNQDIGNKIVNGKTFKESLYNNVLRPAEEQISAEEEKVINDKVKESLATAFVSGEPIDVEFIYNFRKRYKALGYKDVPGYDFMAKGMSAIPEALRDTYQPTGAYILYSNTVNGYPIMLTDRCLYFNDVVINLKYLQQVTCYERALVSTQIPLKMCYVELFGFENSGYTLMPKDDIVLKIAHDISAVVRPYKRMDYEPVENLNDGDTVYLCTRCHNRNVAKQKLIQYICPVCGQVPQGEIVHISPLEERETINNRLAVIEKNIKLDTGFKDEDYWYACANEILDTMPEDQKQNICNNSRKVDPYYDESIYATDPLYTDEPIETITEITYEQTSNIPPRSSVSDMFSSLKDSVGSKINSVSNSVSNMAGGEINNNGINPGDKSSTKPAEKGLKGFGAKFGLGKLTGIKNSTKCPSCGKTVTPGAKFCSFCGAKITSDSDQPDVVQPEISQDFNTNQNYNDYMNSGQYNDIEKYIINNYKPGGLKVQAIKYYRDQTGAGLKEAKDIVDKLFE